MKFHYWRHYQTKISGQKGPDLCHVTPSISVVSCRHTICILCKKFKIRSKGRDPTRITWPIFKILGPLKIAGSTVGWLSKSMKEPHLCPSQPRNALTDFNKIWNKWLHRRRDPSHQIYFFYVFVSPYKWSCQPGVYFLPFFFTFWRSCSPAQIASFVVETSLMAHKTCFREF